MKKIDWYSMVLLSGGIVCGGVFQRYLDNHQMSVWWYLVLIIGVCLASAWIDIKPKKDS